MRRIDSGTLGFACLDEHGDVGDGEGGQLAFGGDETVASVLFTTSPRDGWALGCLDLGMQPCRFALRL